MTLALQSAGASPWARAVPLLDGDPGVAQTIQLIRSAVNEGLKDPQVRFVLAGILRGVPAHDDMAEIRAIYEWVLKNIRYTKDPTGKELVQSARMILSAGIGDCDDINAVLLPVLMGMAGHWTRLVTVAANPFNRDQFTHIYSEVLCEDNGRWIPIDAARRGARFGLAPHRVFRRQVWDLTAMPAGQSGLNGYGVGARVVNRSQLGRLGFDWSSISQLIATGGQAAASIVGAAKGPAYGYNPYVATPYGTPGGSIVATGSVSNLGMSPTTLLIIGGVALLLLSRRS